MGIIESLSIDWGLFWKMMGWVAILGIVVYAEYCFYRHNESLKKEEMQENERN